MSRRKYILVLARSSPRGPWFETPNLKWVAGRPEWALGWGSKKEERIPGTSERKLHVACGLSRFKV